MDYPRNQSLERYSYFSQPPARGGRELPCIDCTQETEREHLFSGRCPSCNDAYLNRLKKVIERNGFEIFRMLSDLMLSIENGKQWAQPAECVKLRMREIYEKMDKLYVEAQL